MTSAGPDVVGQGEEPDEGGGLPPWLRRALVAAAAVVAVLAVTRGGLLSSGEQPPPAPTPDATRSGEAAADGPRLVARHGGRLLLEHDGRLRPGARLPDRFPAGGLLVPVRVLGSTSAPVVGVSAGELFRADADRRRWRPLGPAVQVVGPSQLAGRVYVVRGGAVAEVELATGSTTNPVVFPGYDATWSVEGLLVTDGNAAVVLSRPATDGRRALRLAWSAGATATGGRPRVQDLGGYGPVIGIAADWVLTLDGCPGDACRVVIVSVTRDSVLTRPVEPPPGWTFTAGPSAGRTHEALVPVREPATGRQALARLVPGGDRALLVRGTDRVLLDADLADGPDGTVDLLTAPAGGGAPQVRVWNPEQPNSATLRRPATSVEFGAKLVCVCG